MNKPTNRISKISVAVFDGKVDKALRIFSKKVQDSGKLRLLQSKEFYENPSQARKREKAAAKKRWERKVASTKPTRH